MNKLDALTVTTAINAVNDAENTLKHLEDAGLVSLRMFSNTDAEYQLYSALRALRYLRGALNSVTE